ncbi:MAG: tRNA (adenosine(37)-N6)-threonylcarbamoyltransferase complex ATPase subunit type 1 TsaE [Desulfobacterales bacterium]|jgi:tRNA threonylcarbamoyladenosine biosynthesis protein TsaE
MTHDPATPKTPPISMTCRTEAETRRLACLLGSIIRSPVLILLEGELGSGKTCFAQGLARGLGVPETLPVTSPSYTIVNEYPARLTFIHIDLYRIGPGDGGDIGIDDILDRPAVIAVEWAERLEGYAFGDRLRIRIAPGDDEARRISIRAYGLETENLLQEVDFALKEASWP